MPCCASMLLLLLFVGTPTWGCLSDRDCDIWNPKCNRDAGSSGCYKAACTSDSDCGSLLLCGSGGYCEPILCHDLLSSCPSDDHVTCLGGVCNCDHGYYWSNGSCVSVLGERCIADWDCKSKVMTLQLLPQLSPCRHYLCRG
ncbi:hypothetical protein DPMN_133253 [Dreissena polymorpha]|uniref:Uncharacterized protein n=1 Tax=Dreissena polymorpha TaxID=45954 RepID=A0A9D4FV89_DREPO|nr:hypothetical protein DPMN_133253 [Dreissena polymorpha]